MIEVGAIDDARLLILIALPSRQEEIGHLHVRFVFIPKRYLG